MKKICKVQKNNRH